MIPSRRPSRSSSRTLPAAHRGGRAAGRAGPRAGRRRGCGRRPAAVRPLGDGRLRGARGRRRRGAGRARGRRARSAPASSPTRALERRPGRAGDDGRAGARAAPRAVQPVEKTRAVEGGRRVEILEPVEPGANIARQGSRGARRRRACSSAGRTLDPASIAVLAAVGKGRVRVGRRPTRRRARHRRRAGGRVGHARRAARIRNSNGYARAGAGRAGPAPTRASLGVVPDELGPHRRGRARGLRARTCS